ncbi:hypothetical protein [Acetobacter conturbans]|nr:hypothetical protein [Acetobacter conturbans]
MSWSDVDVTIMTMPAVQGVPLAHVGEPARTKETVQHFVACR